MTAETPKLLSYNSVPRRRSWQTIEALATAVAFFGAISSAGGFLLAAAIEWFSATFFLDQTHEVPVNLHAVSAGLLFVGVVGILSTVSACCMVSRAARRFSLWIAIAQFFVFPIGTILAALTWLTLSHAPAREVYRSRASCN